MTEEIAMQTGIPEQKRLCLCCATHISPGEEFTEVKTRRTSIPTQFHHTNYQDCQSALSPAIHM